MENYVSIKAGGPAGKGIFTIGDLTAKVLHKLGLYVVSTKDYPSLIKGGHNTITIRAEPNKIHSTLETIDVLVALDKQTVDLHYKELTHEGAIIVDEKNVCKKECYLHDRKDIKIYDLPLLEFVKKVGLRYENTILLGASLSLLKVPKELIIRVLKKKFEKKGEEVVNKNIEALNLGYNHINNILKENEFKTSVKKIEPSDSRIFISGNDAASIGAIKAGVKFVAEYPMTPSSSILHFMAAHEESKRIIVKQTEDELAAINMLIGASFAGLRVMTATSGGGFALMNEAFGFSSMAELPLVIIESMRASPSTGMPTHTEQGDLLYAIHASQGEAPRVVITPGDVEEAYYETFNAFNIAENLQLPVVVLLDKHLSSSNYTVERFNTNLKVDRGFLLKENEIKNYLNEEGKFLRYKFTSDGVSPRSIPGQKNGMHVASSYEHDETGWTSEDADNRIKMMNKRFKKLDLMYSKYKDIIKPKFYGYNSEEAEILIVSWGSNKGSILDALKFLEGKGIKARFMHIVYAWPLDKKTILEELEKSKNNIILEANFTAQMKRLIKLETSYEIKNVFLKYTGRPFTSEEITRHIGKLLRGADFEF